MNGMKRQKDKTPEDKPLRLEGVQYATGEEQRVIATGANKNDVTGPKRDRCSAVDVSGGESKI